MERASYQNGFDHLRLLFAAMVLFGHSFALTGRLEPLAALASTGFGGVAVCGFFILSGYLIAQSLGRSPGVVVFLRNRALRIVPGFVVAYFISVLVFGALGAQSPANYLGAIDWPLTLRRLLLVQGPPNPVTFAGAPFPFVNGSMWTVSYEILCYLAAPLVLFSRKTLAVSWMVAAAYVLMHGGPGARFVLMFLSGAAFAMFDLRVDRRIMLLGGLACLAALPFARAWEITLAVGGSAALIGLGKMEIGPRIPDISFGLYLYGWPVQKLLIWYGLNDPWLMFPVALILASAFGAASWWGVEKKALAWKTRGRVAAQPVLAATVPTLP